MISDEDEHVCECELISKPPPRSCYMPGRPYAPRGIASLDPALRPHTLDAPKYGCDTTGGSPWPLYDYINQASNDPGADPFVIAGGLGLAALLLQFAVIFGIGWLIYKVFVK